MRTQSSLAGHSICEANVVLRPFSLRPTAVTKRSDDSEREMLIAAATELFWRYGFKATSVRDIAVAAGCPATAVRRAFGGKTALLECVLRRLECRESPALPSDCQRRTLREEICQLIQREALRMKGHREVLTRMFRGERTGPNVTRVVGDLIFSSSQLMAERLSRYTNLNDAQQQFLLCAIQSVGFALGFVKLNPKDPVCTMNRIKQLATTLADEIEGRNVMPDNVQSLLLSRLPI
jgi:AcrR family transcriptional regulator